ncbi:MAG: hypothetical protein U9Q82_14950 [Chloroflexota bacterium]|nr:hypothetical protein [Chloroflexota bacterium]
MISIPIFSVLTILQSAVLSRMPLLHGTADVVLLVVIAWALQERVRTALQWSLVAGIMMGYVSILPYSVPLVSYLGITGLTLVIRRYIWKIPILAMFVITLIGTLFNHSLSALVVSIGGAALPWLNVLQMISIPSLFLNLLLAAPVYAVVKDIANWLYPEEIEI